MENFKIVQTENCKRGYGRMTAGLFKNTKVPARQSGWDYVEIIYNLGGDRQDSAKSLKKEDCQLIVGKTIEEIKKMKKLRVLVNKWHTPSINKLGEITSLIC